MTASPGMMLGEPGSKAMLPTVQTVRGPQSFGNASSMATAKRAAARPASFRMAMRVVPAWFCTPVKVMRHCVTPTMLVTTPILRSCASSQSPCSMWASM